MEIIITILAIATVVSFTRLRIGSSTGLYLFLALLFVTFFSFLALAK